MRKVGLAQSKTLLSAALVMVTTLLPTGAAVGQESGSDTFIDVPAGHWADQAIGWAVANDITRGTAADRFDPDGTVTRAQIVTFLYRTFHFIQGNPVTAGAAEGTIAFSSNRDGDHEVYLMNSDGSNVRQLTHNTRHYDWLPAWSPDATRIAFTSNRDGDFEIFVMNPDGTNQHQLTHNISFDTTPNWSPDGARIAFTRYRDGDAEVFVMDADGANQHQLAYNSRDDGLPSWSPDGAQIAFQSNRDGDEEIFVMNSDGTNQHQLTHNDRDDLDPSWSPDGTQIAFTRDLETGAEVLLMNSNGGNQQRLTFDDHHQTALPSWSPDGTRIAFNRYLDGDAEIFVMNADGSNRRQISDNDHQDWISTAAWSSYIPSTGSDLFSDVPEGHWAEEAIGWAVTNGIITGTGEGAFDPDGTVSRSEIVTFIYDTVNLIPDHQTDWVGWNTSPTMTSGLVAFSSNRDGDWEIFVMNPDGANQRQLTHNDRNDRYPSWPPDGTQIAFTSSRDGDEEIFVMNADGTDQRQLTSNYHRDSAPSWSPDGTQITFSSFFDDPSPEDYGGSREDGTQITLSRFRGLDSPSQPGSAIGGPEADDPGEIGDWEVLVVNADGANLRQLTHDNYDDMAPSWSPDSTQITFQSSQDGDTEIFVMNADGTIPHQLTHNSHYDVDPSWSPDGARIAFASYREGDAEIFLMNADGTNLRQLTDNNHYDAAPAWSPDGAQIAFQRWGDGDNDVYLMNADGTAQRKLTNKQGSDFFDDIPVGHRANETIGWAATYGITSGVGQSRFAPDGTVTRAQIVTFLHRMVNLAQSTRSPS